MISISLVVLSITFKTSSSLKSKSLLVTKSATGIVSELIIEYVFLSDKTSWISGFVPTTASHAKNRLAEAGAILWLNVFTFFS